MPSFFFPSTRTARPPTRRSWRARPPHDGTRGGGENVLKDSPLPSLQLAKVMKEKGDRKGEREHTERAIQIDNNSVDAWAYLANSIREQSGDEKMISQVEELAKAPVNSKS